MTRLLTVFNAPATNAGSGTLSTVLASQTSYENLVIQLTNTGSTASTAQLQYFRHGDGTAYRISPSAIALDTTGAVGANVAEVTLPGLNPGDTLKILVTCADNTDFVQVLVWGKLATPAQA